MVLTRLRSVRWVWRLILVLGLLAIGYASLPRITDRISDTVFGNAIPSTDLEPAIMAQTPRWSVDEWSVLAGRGEGLDCSIPPAALAVFAGKHGKVQLASINLWFRQACVAHDLCYRHGRATYGYTQTQCDAALVESSFRICRQIVGTASNPWCVDQARKVLGGVTFGGFSSFRGASDDRGALDTSSSDNRHFSVLAEYEPYPAGNAVYSVPRLVHGDCFGRPNVPILIQFLHQPGGSDVNVRCFDGHSFVTPTAASKTATAIGSEFPFRIGAPWISDATSPSRLLQWCRYVWDNKKKDRPDATTTETPDNTTRGRFQLQDNATGFLGCPALSSLGFDDAQDPDVVTPFPVPGHLAAQVPAFGLTKGSLTYFRMPGPLHEIKAPNDPRTLCRDHDGNQIRCSIALPNTCDRSPDKDRYRWFATTPIAIAGTASAPGLPEGPSAEVTIFARGCNNEENYQTLISHSTTLTDGGFFHEPGKPASFGAASFWNLPETAEPFVPMSEGGHLVGLLSVHAVKQPDAARLAWWGSVLRIGSAIALIAMALMILNLVKSDLAVALALGAFGAAGLLVAHWLTAGLSPDGFSEDAEIVVYRPGPDEHSMPDAKPVLFPAGRPWLQQRMSVLRSGTDYLVLMPRFHTDRCSSKMCLTMAMARVSLNGADIPWKADAVPLPDWARLENFSKLSTVPFRDEYGDLAVLVLGPSDRHIVLKSVPGKNGLPKFKPI
jgi:hypothetical protein